MRRGPTSALRRWNSISLELLARRHLSRQNGPILANSRNAGETPLAVRSEMLGVSRGTARAAVRSLVDAGLLDVRQGSGTFVMSAQEMSADVKRIRRTGLRNQFEVRRALEVEAARLAATRATSKDIQS